MTIIPPIEETVIETAPPRAVPPQRWYRRMLKSINTARQNAAVAVIIALLAFLVAFYAAFVQHDATGKPGLDMSQVDKEICIKQVDGLARLNLITFTNGETAASVCSGS